MKIKAMYESQIDVLKNRRVQASQDHIEKLRLIEIETQHRKEQLEEERRVSLEHDMEAEKARIHAMHESITVQSHSALKTKVESIPHEPMTLSHHYKSIERTPSHYSYTYKSSPDSHGALHSSGGAHTSGHLDSTKYKTQAFTSHYKPTVSATELEHHHNRMHTDGSMTGRSGRSNNSDFARAVSKDH